MLVDSVICGIRNLGRKRSRSLLTIASIAIGVASVVLIGSIGEIGRQTISLELNSLGLGSMTVSVDKKFSDVKMTEEDLALLRESPAVRGATPVIMELGSIRMRGLVANAVLWGVDGGDSQVISLAPKYGRMLGESDLSTAADVCVIDQNVAELFYKRGNIVGKRLDAMIGGSYVSLEIVGVASSGGNILQNIVGDVVPSFAYVPYTTLQRYSGESTFDQIAVTLQSDRDAAAASTQLSSSLNRLHNIKRGFKTDNITKQKDALNNLLGIVTTVLSAVAGVSLVVAGLGIMTIMIVSVNERTREIGIKKAIGATRGIIMLEFLAEAFTISLVGSVAGVGVGLLTVWLGCMAMSIPMQSNLSLVGASVALSVTIGVLFGVYPAIIAAKLRPVDALRTE